MKKVLLTVLLGILFSGTLVAQDNQHYDFSAVCSSGQTLYYRQITNEYIKKKYHIEGVKNPVEVIAPHKKPDIYVYNYDGFAKPTGNVTIPSQVTHGGITYTVAFVGPYAFTSCEDLKSVIIPNTVVLIDHEAFKECRKLNSITMPNLLKEIGREAFYSCSSLQSINIPTSVKEIGSGAFQASGLRSIKFPNATTLLSSSVCSSCDYLESVVLPANLEYIGDYAFCGCEQLKSITIPNTVTEIVHDAFNGCYCLQIKVPNTMKKVGYNAFKDCLNVIYHGKLEGAPWKAKCLNGYVEGDCVYKDKTKNTLVAVSEVEEERRQENARAERERQKLAERASQVNVDNIMGYVKSIKVDESTDGFVRYEVTFYKNNAKDYIFYNGAWSNGYSGNGIQYHKSDRNARERALVDCWKFCNRLGKFD